MTPALLIKFIPHRSFVDTQLCVGVAWRVFIREFSEVRISCEDTLTVTDPDSATVTISEVPGGDSGLFTMDTNNGVVTANTTNSSFNFEDPQDGDAALDIGTASPFAGNEGPQFNTGGLVIFAGSVVSAAIAQPEGASDMATTVIVEAP